MATRSFPLSRKTGRGLGCGWHLGNFGILEGHDSPVGLFLYDDQGWAGFYFAVFELDGRAAIEAAHRQG